MLGFFRRYQKGFFIVVAIAIGVTFSFFGTYNTLNLKSEKDEDVMEAVDGTSIKRSEVEALVQFISTDQQDSLLLGAPLGPNFLNDGVLRKDFFHTGLAKELVSSYSEDLKGEWDEKWAKEKRYTPYSHPEVEFISALGVWGQFAPELKAAFLNYKGSHEDVADRFQAKVDLYMAETAFPQVWLRQVLGYMMQQNNWVKPDPAIQRQDFSLFGYHSANDWFGKDFIRLVAGFIINSAKVAEERGYTVSREEALADLMKQAGIAFKNQEQNPNMSISNPNEYFQQQLRYLGMDVSKASKVWQNVLLFRRMFSDLGQTMLVDRDAFSPYCSFVNEEAEVVSYHLPKEFQFNSFKDLQLFEVYLDAVSKGGEGLRSPQDLSWLEVDQVKEVAMKRHLLEVASFDRDLLLQKVPVRQVWDYECAQENWEQIQAEVPQLASLEGDSLEDRFGAIDELDGMTRSRLDRTVRGWIAAKNDEWLEEALDRAPFEKKMVHLYRNDTSDYSRWISALEKSDEIVTFHEEDGTSYRVKLVLQDDHWSVPTFSQAKEDGILDRLLTARLEEYYQSRKNDGAYKFTLVDGSYKPLEDVRDELAEELFRTPLHRLQALHKEATTPDLAASYRFSSYLEGINYDELETVVSTGETEDLAPLSDQFRLVANHQVWNRGNNLSPVALEKVEKMAVKTLSEVNFATNGDLFFYQVKSFNHPSSVSDVQAMTKKADATLSTALQQLLMHDLVKELKSKGALSLEKYHEVDVQA